MRANHHIRSKAAVFLALLLLVSLRSAVYAQGTAFTYQGKLADSGAPANGNYDFEFKLFDSAAVGTGAQQGSTVQRFNVNVVGGVFNVSLDFGACASCFNGADRFLEISVKPTSGGAFTTLGPRQPINSTPYALKSANATAADGLSVACVSCITSSQVQSVQGSQVTGNIMGTQISGVIPVASVPSGSANYVQNSTAQQAASNFNISGSGVAGALSAPVVNASGLAGRYLINGFSVLSNGGLNNLFAGVDAGVANNGGGSNSFFGSQAGTFNTTGFQNSFFGRSAGDSNTTGAGNAFFGTASGFFNTTGNENAFFGEEAGRLNTTGGWNSFFGMHAGDSNGTGSENTLIGYFSDVGANNLTNATAIGANARVDASNSLVLGSINGSNGATADTSVGIGTTAPATRLDVVDDATAIRFGATTADEGGYLASFGPSVAVLAGGARFNGSTFIAKSTTSSHMTLSNGQIRFYGETGLTPGSIIDLKERMTIDTTGFVGIGTNSPAAPLHIISGSSGATPNANASLILERDVGHFLNILGPDGAQTGVLFGRSTGGGSVAGIVFNNPSIPDGLQFRTGGSTSSHMSITSAGDVGIGTGVPADKLHVLGIIRVSNLGMAGSTSLCRNSSEQIATCSSSLRYKTDITPFIGGLDVVNRLRPINFTWKQSGIRDIGFGAEDVARVAPQFTFTNDKGEIEGVKYDRITVLLVNAIKQQQQQIEQRELQAAVQEQQIKQLNAESDELKQRLLQIKPLEEAVRSLKKLVCLDHPTADVCR